jgi:hypothetical protein
MGATLVVVWILVLAALLILLTLGVYLVRRARRGT